MNAPGDDPTGTHWSEDPDMLYDVEPIEFEYGELDAADDADRYIDEAREDA